MLIHCLGRLGAAAAVLAAELPCGDGVFAQKALERAKAVHHFDGVMSHNFKYRRLFRCDSELKLPSPPAAQSWLARSLHRGWALVLNRFAAGPLQHGLRRREYAPHVPLLSPPEERTHQVVYRTGHNHALLTGLELTIRKVSNIAQAPAVNRM